MPSTSLTVLAQRAAIAADMEDNFVSDDAWRYWANVENRNLAVKLAHWGFPWKSNDTSFTMTGALQYSTEEPLAVIAFFWIESDGRYTRLGVANPAQRQGYGFSTGTPREITIQRNTNDMITFSLYPNPSSGAVVMRSIEQPAELVYSGPTSSQSTTVTYPLDWEELIVLKMARRALAKEETINSFIEQQIQEMELSIRDACTDFLMSDTHVIRNVRDDNVPSYIDSTEWIFV